VAGVVRGGSGVADDKGATGSWSPPPASDGVGVGLAGSAGGSAVTRCTPGVVGRTGVADSTVEVARGRPDNGPLGLPGVASAAEAASAEGTIGAGADVGSGPCAAWSDSEATLSAGFSAGLSGARWTRAASAVVGSLTGRRARSGANRGVSLRVMGAVGTGPTASGRVRRLASGTGGSTGRTTVGSSSGTGTEPDVTAVSAVGSGPLAAVDR
jgi:hypothetical protein